MIIRATVFEKRFYGAPFEKILFISCACFLGKVKAAFFNLYIEKFDLKIGQNPSYVV